MSVYVKSTNLRPVPILTLETIDQLPRLAPTTDSLIRARLLGQLPPAQKVKRLMFQAAAAGEIQMSPSGLIGSNESAIAINPKNPRNIVAGAATPNLTNPAYVSMDGGNTWKMYTAISDILEGAAIAFDDAGVCYYLTLIGGLQAGVAISLDGGITWSKPTMFSGSADKTAVAARGTRALCGWDDASIDFGGVIQTAVTTDSGKNWTQSNVPGNNPGIAASPAVGYDGLFHMVWAGSGGMAYSQSKDGVNWSPPTTIVAGTERIQVWEGPLAYETVTLTCPGTCVAVDKAGNVYVVYRDQATEETFLVKSKDNGKSWLKPFQVDPNLKAPDAAHVPCASCTPGGQVSVFDLVYHPSSNMYEVFRHYSADQAQSWVHAPATNKPFAAAGPAPGFRIGFGDYFDCDSVTGLDAAAWSESPGGQQPWETWGRITSIVGTSANQLLIAAIAAGLIAPIAGLLIFKKVRR